MTEKNRIEMTPASTAVQVSLSFKCVHRVCQCSAKEGRMYRAMHVDRAGRAAAYSVPNASFFGLVRP